MRTRREMCWGGGAESGPMRPARPDQSSNSLSVSRAPGQLGGIGRKDTPRGGSRTASPRGTTIGIAVRSSVSIRAAREIGVAVDLVLGDRQVHVRSVLRAPVVLADREHLIRRTAVLANQPPHVAETLATGEGPEGLLAEQKIDARGSRAEVDERRKRIRVVGDRAQRELRG